MTKPTIHVRITRKMKEGIDALAKEYDTTISAIMRTLIADVLDDEMVDDTAFRPYKSRKGKESE